LLKEKKKAANTRLEEKAITMK